MNGELAHLNGPDEQACILGVEFQACGMLAIAGAFEHQHQTVPVLSVQLPREFMVTLSCMHVLERPPSMLWISFKSISDSMMVRGKRSTLRQRAQGGDFIPTSFGVPNVREWSNNYHNHKN